MNLFETLLNYRYQITYSLWKLSFWHVCDLGVTGMLSVIILHVILDPIKNDKNKTNVFPFNLLHIFYLQT